MGMIVDTFDSPLGKILLCSDGEYLTAVIFDGQKYGDRHIPLDAVAGTCSVLETTKLWLTEYFLGNVPQENPPMKPVGTAFQKRVWKKLLEIPHGKTVTYGELAKALGCRSAQAVGGAVGRNPISILIPCHRVVGADGTLTGYAGGVEKKEFLLSTEKYHKGKM
jgi:methylated-DNA-[protein]-cysteine S-methyltransferase